MTNEPYKQIITLTSGVCEYKDGNCKNCRRRRRIAFYVPQKVVTSFPSANIKQFMSFQKMF